MDGTVEPCASMRRHVDFEFGMSASFPHQRADGDSGHWWLSQAGFGGRSIDDALANGMGRSAAHDGLRKDAAGIIGR